MRAGVLALALLLAGAGGAAEPALSLKPLLGGPVHCAVVCPRYTGLDVEALAARFDLEAQVVNVWERTHLGFDPVTDSGAPEDFSHDAVAARLMALLGKKAPEVVVLANLDASALPVEFQEALRAHVERGGSLALAYVTLPDSGPLRTLADSATAMEEDPGLGRGIPEAFAPDGTSLATAAHPGVYGSGRVLTFTYSGDLPQTHALFPPAAPGLDPDPHHVDHACLLWGRALLWLAGRTPERLLTGLTNVSPDGPADEETPPDLPEEFVASMHDTVVAQLVRPFSLTLDAAAEKDYRVELRLRPMFAAGPGYKTESNFPRGVAMIATQLLTGPGVYFVDAVLKRKEEVVDWYSTSVAIPGWPEFTAIRADRTYVQPNDRVMIEAEVRPVYSTHRSATVYAQALDSFGRLVAQAWQPITHTGGRVLLQLPFADLTAPLVEVRILALEGEPHLITPWDFYAGAVETLRFPVKLNRQDAALNWVVRMDTALESNAGDYLSRLSGLGVTHVVAPGGRPALVTAARSGVLLLPLAGDYRPQAVVEGNVRFPSLSDSGYTQREDDRLRDEVLDYFAGASGAYLLGDPALVVESEQNACQSPESLTAFRGWAEAQALTLPEDDDALRVAIAAPSTAGEESGAHYTDFRLFMEEELAGFLGKRRDVLRQAQPQALAGAGALRDDNPYRGYDWHALSSKLDFVAAEWDLVTCFKLASYQQATPLSGIKAEADWDAARLVNHLWLSTMAGFGSIWTPQPVAGALDGGEGMLLTASGAATEKAVILAAAWQHANAALAPLLRAATPAPPVVAVLDAPRSRHTSLAAGAAYTQQQALWLRRLAAAGHWPAFVHTEDLGQAYKRGTRALAWSAGTVLSAGELATLRAFLAEGGRLLVDASGAETAAEAATQEERIELAAEAGVLALDEALRAREITPPLPVSAEAFAKAGGLSALVRAYRYDSADIYVSVPWPEGAPEKPHDTVLDTGKEVSLYHPLVTVQTTRSKQGRLPGDEAGCLVRLPYAVRELELAAPEEVVAGTRLDLRALLKTDTLQPGKHLIRATLSPVMGQPIAGGVRTFVCAQGRGESYIAVPLNAVPGDYMVELRDLLTGRTARQTVEVLSPGGPGFQALH
jgi:hypothetical protein